MLIYASFYQAMRQLLFSIYFKMNQDKILRGFQSHLSTYATSLGFNLGVGFDLNLGREKL